MRLEHFVELIAGKLRNKPSISQLGKMQLQANAICNGDIFLVRSDDYKIDENIALALNRGAYAIVSEKKIKISDDEIAWILVSSVENAILKFFRYKKIMENLPIFYFQKAAFQIAQGIIKDKKVGFARNIYELVYTLDRELVIIDFEESLLNSEVLESAEMEHFRVVKSSIFELHIELHGELGREFELIFPSFFSGILNDVLHFAKMRHLELNIMAANGLLMPTFINSSGFAMRQSRSMRFVYSSDDCVLLGQLCELVSRANWGRAMILGISGEKLREIVPQNCKIHIQEIESLKSLTQHLQKNEYHFFIIAAKHHETEQILTPKNIEPSLF